MILLLLTGTCLCLAQDDAPKKVPYPPNERPPYQIDQPIPKHSPEPPKRKVDPAPAPEEVQHPEVEPQPEPPTAEEPGGRSRMPGYIVFVGILLLLLSKVPAGKKRA